MFRQFILIVSAFLLLGHAALAQEQQNQTFDPLKRNLIFVDGQAEATVPVNGFSLIFHFDVNKGSFDEGRQESQKIIDNIKLSLEQLGIKDYELIQGWDMVRQAKISLSSKGRKITNNLIVKVKSFPSGQLYAQAALLIDRVIAANDSMELVEINVFVTEENEQKARQDVLAKAVQNLDRNAAQITQALGRKITGIKRIYTAQGRAIDQGQMYQGNYDFREEHKFLAKSLISVQKSFKVPAEITDSFKFTASVSGIYQVE